MGAFIGSKSMGVYGLGIGLDIFHSVLGGFFMLLGSRIASGCTSGHGISGMSLLSIPSIAAVMGMFVNAFVVGLSYNAISSALYNSAKI